MNRREMKKRLKAQKENPTIPETEDYVKERTRQRLLKEGIDLDWLDLSVEIEKIPCYLDPVIAHFERKKV